MNTKISPCIFQTLYSFQENHLDLKEAIDKIFGLPFSPPISLTEQATQDVIVEILIVELNDIKCREQEKADNDVEPGFSGIKNRQEKDGLKWRFNNHRLIFICSSSSFAQAIEKSFKAQTLTLARTVAEDENV